MYDILKMIGFWIWVIIGLVLLISELVAAGMFLMWFGIAALLTAFTLWFLQHFVNVAFWEIQVILFLIYSALSLYVGIKYFRHNDKTEEPLLNQRTEQMIGQLAILVEDMKNGHGHVRLDDTIWRVVGPNLSTGCMVRLLKYQNGAFLVEKAD